jgi:dissimilatory sulfite reductase (desulfoviridin) alpha/beta subunit
MEALSFDDALKMVETVVAHYKVNSKRERMGRMIERIGLDTLRADLKIH